MKKGLVGFCLLVAVAMMFNACRRDPSLPDEKTPYAVTYIQKHFPE